MRPLRLRIQAFGPYGDVVDLDFAHLQGHSLFLIHGPTGAGKTSILDAMCFALFGDASGSERSAKEARSHFADAALPTQVTLEFALGARRFRVTRIAEQARPGGATMKPAQAVLERLGDGDAKELLASRVREVDEAVSDLLGFQVEQFRQVVLLPQGEFRRLLVSDSKEREKILETLFGAETWRRVEAELKRAASSLEREVADGRTRIAALLGGSDAESVEALEVRATSLDSRAADLSAAVEASRKEAGAAAEAAAAAEKTAALLLDHRRAVAELAAAVDASSAADSQREELAAARRAQGLAALAERLANAKAAAARENGRAAAAGAALAERRAGAERAAAALSAEEARGPERDAARDLARRLEAAGEAASRLRDLEAAIEKTALRVADATGAASLNQRDIGYAQGRVAAADKELALLRPLAAQAEVRRGVFARAREALTAAGSLEAARSFLLRQSVEVGGARERLAKAEAAVVALTAAEAELLRRWSGGQAALLARALVDGEPCPVCGSAEHPHPAVAAGEIASQADVEEARASLAKARERVDACRRDVDKEKAKEEELRGEVRRLEGLLGGDAEKTSADLAASLASAEAALVEAGKADARAKQLEVEKQTELAAIAEANADREAALVRAAEEEKALARDRGKADELRLSLPADLVAGGVASLPARLAEATRRAAGLDKALEDARTANAAAVAALAAAEADVRSSEVASREAGAALASASAGLEAALGRAGFASVDALISARRSAAELDALEAALARHDAALAAAKSHAARAAAAAAGLEEVDVAAARSRAEAARSALEALLADESRTREALAVARRTLAALGDEAARIAEADARYRAVGRVAAVASGSNEAGVSLVRFVLGSLLDDVLAAATERLLRMSQGRFSLARAGSRRDRRRSGGLDLEVLDAHTGLARPASTLSGGEGFLASLSLALGLADVVQSHTGGIHLETMFVDEGFGTLDPEALDAAMRALEDLQAGGRLVGIISHVPELRERIGAGLEVVAGRRGSSARFVT